MAEVDPQKVIDRLATRLANSHVHAAVLESQLESTQQELAAARQELSETRTQLAKAAAPSGD